MLKKKLSIIFIIVLFLLSLIIFIPHNKTYRVVDIITPTKILLNNNQIIEFEGIETFDPYYTKKNQILAKQLKISEKEAFIMGNISKYWASNLLKDREVYIKNPLDIVYLKHSYKTKLLYSGYCFIDSKPYSKFAFEKRLNEIQKAKYKVFDLEKNSFYEPNSIEIKKLKNFVLIKNSHIPIKLKENKKFLPKFVYQKDNIKVIFSDSTTKIIPDRNCSSLICKEIKNSIDNSVASIDMAIYGYSKTPAIEEALKSAIKRGVEVRIIYDLDSNGKNIYPDTNHLTAILPNAQNDGKTEEAKNIMHNKFYIFDNKKVITGSANLSHTDMSGYNSNSIIIINSNDVAKIYKQEFEQMYNGFFHTQKIPQQKNKITLSGTDLEIFFSPQDKSITNAILPLIRNAERYIYIPTFVLTERRVTEELIKAKHRGVDVKIIIDALNASIKHSKHKELRQGGIQVKTENYAGKMHSKSLIVDDKYTVIGSMNFSNSGENRNDENLVVIKNTEVAKFYKNFFLYQWNRIDDKWLRLNVRAEGLDSIGSCFDGIDNNYDGLTDDKDPACSK